VSTIVAESKLQDEEIFFSTDFLSRCAVGENCVTVATTVQVFTGVDANPAAILSGAPTITNNVAQQKIVGGVPGVVYLLTFAARSSVNAVYLNQMKIAVLTSPALNP
jgi:hypothetical protein